MWRALRESNPCFRRERGDSTYIGVYERFVIANIIK
jgi:hypothetical protein